MTDHDAEMDAILDLLEGVGLVEVYVNTDGKQAMRLTDDGGRVGAADGDERRPGWVARCATRGAV